MVEPATDECMVACSQKCQITARIGHFRRSPPLAVCAANMVRAENLLEFDDEFQKKAFEPNYATAIAPLTLTHTSRSIRASSTSAGSHPSSTHPGSSSIFTRSQRPAPVVI